MALVDHRTGQEDFLTYSRRVDPPDNYFIPNHVYKYYWTIGGHAYLEVEDWDFKEVDGGIQGTYLTIPKASLEFSKLDLGGVSELNFYSNGLCEISNLSVLPQWLKVEIKKYGVENPRENDHHALVMQVLSIPLEEEREVVIELRTGNIIKFIEISYKV